MAAVIGSLRAELSATIAQFQRDLGKAADSVRSMQKEFSKIGRDFQQTGRQMQGVGMALTKTITLPLVAFGGAAAKAAIQFESSFANVAKTVDGVSDSSGKLTETGKALAQTFRDMAKSIPATTDELTAIAALGGQMGVPTAQLEKFTKNVAALGVAVDGISTEEAAAGLASIGNATGQGTQNIDKMASALVHLGNNSNATEGDILEFTKRLIGAGNAVGMTVPEVMAIGTAMANVGISAEAGGTAMSTLISKMSNAVSKGGESLAEFAKVAGLSAEDFAAKWKTKPVEAVNTFLNGLSSMRERGVDLNLTMGELGTEGIRIQDMLKRMAGQTDGVATALKFANEGYETSNKHLEEAQKKYATTANQLKLLWNQINDVAITLGDAMIPAIKTMIEWLGKLLPYIDGIAQAFKALPGEIQAAFLILGGLGAALGPALWVTGQLIESVGTLTLAFGKGGVGARALTGLINTLRGALIAMRNVEIGSGLLGILAQGGKAGLIGLGIAGTAIFVAEMTDKLKADLAAAAEAAKNSADKIGQTGKPVEEVAKKIITLADAQAAAALHGQDLADGVTTVDINIASLAKNLGIAIPVAQTFGQKLADAQAELDKFAKDRPKEFADFVTAVKSGHFEVDELKTKFQLSTLAIDLFNDQLDRNETAMKAAADAAKQEKEQLEDIRDEFYKLALAFQAIEDAAEAIELGEQFDHVEAQFRFIASSLDDVEVGAQDAATAIDEINGVASQIGAIFQKQRDEAVTAMQAVGKNLKQVFDGIPKLLVSAFTGGGGFIGAMKGLGVQIADAVLDPLIRRFQDVLIDFGKDLAGVIAKAFAGRAAANIAGGAASSYVSTAVAGTAAASTVAAGGVAAAATPAIPVIAGTAIDVGAGTGVAATGLTMAQAVPIIGAVALGVYGVYRGFKALKEQAAHKEVNRLREQFFLLQGGLESINPRVQEMTGNVEAVQAVFDARNPEEYQKALANLNGILDEYNAKWEEQIRLFEDELMPAVETFKASLEGVTTITPGVQEALDKVFDESTTEGYLGAIKTLNDELAKQKKNYEDVGGALDKYGIAFKDAGKNFQQAKMNERAQTLIKDFILLRDSGVEINAQMRGMGPSINEFVKDAKKAGVEVPESMRSIIQHAIDAGEVFDEDGKKITNMSQLGLTFGTTMETTMTKVGQATDRLVLVLEDLAKFLKDKLPAAAKTGAEGVNRELDKIEDVEVDVNVNPPSGLPDKNAPTGEPQVPGFATGSGGVMDFGAGTLAMLHGREAVIPESDLRRAYVGTQLATAPPVTVNMVFNVDGVFSDGDLVQTVQRRVVPIVAQTIEDNVAGSRTRFQDVLGVT
jgi:TP901 family phage tail tape measure protein